MAAHTQRRHAREPRHADDHARHVLAFPPHIHLTEYDRYNSARRLPEGYRRLYGVERASGVRMRRLGPERVPQQAPPEGQYRRHGAVELQYLVRRHLHARQRRPHHGRGITLAQGAGRGRRAVGSVPLCRLGQPLRMDGQPLGQGCHHNLRGRQEGRRDMDTAAHRDTCRRRVEIHTLRAAG